MIYKVGDVVPQEWFSKLENVKSITFHCDCKVEMEGGIRVVSRAGDGPYMVYFEGIDGAHMTVEANPTIHWITEPVA